ncbi:helix-turn-helix domain-containing protein [Streptomyces niveiscabiei]|uniref:Helix-turn-helix domain-containing protein n=1 Tax=Streptomyces niveiscabiei TaxID=164115 RepID=A0ABW9I7H1_9ACTN
MAEHLGDRIRRLRKVADLTQQALSERSDVSADVIKKLEQKRKHSVRLPTLHSLARGLGVELTTLLGDPPGAPSSGDADSPQLVALRRAIAPPMFSPPSEPTDVEHLSLPLLRREIADGWTLYHKAEFDALMAVLPGIVNDARFVASVGSVDGRAAGQAALGKSLQLAGHLAIRLGKTDLALSALERAMNAASDSSDPLLSSMISNSVAWNYQRQNRLDDAGNLAIHAADGIEKESEKGADGLKVWGGLIMSAATSFARSGNYDTANEMMEKAEKATKRLKEFPPPDNGKMVSVFNRSSVRIERVRLAVQHERPEEALSLAKGMRLSSDTPPSWRTWLLLDVAQAHADLGDPEGAVRALESLRKVAPVWMRHHTLAVAIVTDLLAGPYRPPGLRKLAEFLGIAS